MNERVLGRFTAMPDMNKDARLRMLPRGGIIVYWETTAPDGFLLCDGASYSATDYRKLCEALEITTTTFTVPNIAAPVAGTAYIIKT